MGKFVFYLRSLIMPSPETSNLELGSYLGFKINHKLELKSQHLTRDINDVFTSHNGLVFTKILKKYL